MADSKNKMVDQSIEQVDNYKVKPESFSYKSHASRDAQSGLPHGTAEGKDKMASGICESPANLEDSGDMTPAVWGKGGKAFTVQTSKGESDEGSPSKVSMDCGVDFETGQVVPNVEHYR